MNLTNSFQIFNDVKKHWIDQQEDFDSPTSLTSEERYCSQQMKLMKAVKLLKHDFNCLINKQHNKMCTHHMMAKDEVSEHYKNLLYDRLKYLSRAHKKLKKNQVIRKNQHILKGLSSKKKVLINE